MEEIDKKIKKEDIEKYIQTLEINPDSKYILIISNESGLSPGDIARIKLNDNFLDEILYVAGNPNEMVISVPISKK